MEKRETFAQALCAILVKHNVISEAEGRSMQRSFKNSSKENTFFELQNTCFFHSFFF